jgi:flagellar basal body-associated protein FliL
MEEPMTWNEEQEAELGRLEQETDEITVNTLKNLYRNLDISLDLKLKTDAQYRDEAILQLAAARERMEKSNG